MAALIAKADPVILEMIENKDMGLGDRKKVRSNTSLFCTFLLNDGFLKDLEKRIGLDADQSCWPYKSHGITLLDKIDELYPGFSKVWNPKKEKFRPRPVRSAVNRRIQYTNNLRKDKFGIPRGKINIMVIRFVEFSSWGHKIRKTFALKRVC